MTTPEGDTVSDHPDDERLDDSHAAMTEATRRRQRSNTLEMSFVAGAAVLIAVSTVFGAWNTFELRRLTQDAAKIRDITLLGTECIVEQLAEHRHLNALVHRAGAAHQGYTYPIAPEQEPPPAPGKLEESCALFISTTTSVGRR